MIRMQVTLDEGEAEELAKWATSELRDPRDQIRFILRRALQQRDYEEAQPDKKENYYDRE